MTTHVRSVGQGSVSVRAGTVALALGILFATAVAFTYVLSLSDRFNPPNWVRVIGLVWLPIGFGGTPIAYILAGRGEGRRLARTGGLIMLVALIAFVALFVAIG